MSGISKRLEEFTTKQFSKCDSWAKRAYGDAVLRQAVWHYLSVDCLFVGSATTQLGD